MEYEKRNICLKIDTADFYFDTKNKMLNLLFDYPTNIRAKKYFQIKIKYIVQKNGLYTPVCFNCMYDKKIALLFLPKSIILEFHHL